MLLYHRLGLPKLGSLVAGQYVAPRLFRSQLDYLAARGWKGVSLTEILQNSETAQNDQFSVTFDDGYLSVYDHAIPALRERGITATIYVVTGSIGGINEWDRNAGDQQEAMMSRAQVRELADAGFEIGSHTATHPRLTELTDDELVREIVDSKKALEDVIGKQVTTFSYPYGNYDARVVRAVIEAGYSTAVSTRLGAITEGVSAFEIPRANIRWNTFGPLLARKINRARRASGIVK